MLRSVERRCASGDDIHADVQDVGAELAATAPLSVTFESEIGLAHASSGDFRVQECHVDLVTAAKWVSLLRDSPLSGCLRSATLSDWSVVKEDALLFFEESCCEGLLEIHCFHGAIGVLRGQRFLRMLQK